MNNDGIRIHPVDYPSLFYHLRQDFSIHPAALYCISGTIIFIVEILCRLRESLYFLADLSNTPQEGDFVQCPLEGYKYLGGTFK